MLNRTLHTYSCCIFECASIITNGMELSGVASWRSFWFTLIGKKERQQLHLGYSAGRWQHTSLGLSDCKMPNQPGSDPRAKGLSVATVGGNSGTSIQRGRDLDILANPLYHPSCQTIER